MMPVLLQHLGNLLAGLHRDGADEDGPALVVNGGDFLEDGVEFFAFGLIDRVVGVRGAHRAVGGDDQDAQFVDVEEFARLGFGGAGHAGQFFVKAEIVLNGDGGQGLGFALDLHAFLGFDRLVQTVAPAPAIHGAPGVFVHDDDLAVFHHVMNVQLVEAVGLEQLGDGVDVAGLRFELGLDFAPSFQPLARVGFRAGVNLMKFHRQIGQHEGVRVLGRMKLRPFSVRSASWLFSSMAKKSSSFSA